MTPQEYKAHCAKDTIKIGSDLDDLPWDDYEGNLLNYFCGMTPQESKEFNRRIKWKTLKNSSTTCSIIMGQVACTHKTELRSKFLMHFYFILTDAMMQWIIGIGATVTA